MHTLCKMQDRGLLRPKYLFGWRCSMNHDWYLVRHTSKLTWSRAFVLGCGVRGVISLVLLVGAIVGHEVIEVTATWRQHFPQILVKPPCGDCGRLPLLIYSTQLDKSHAYQHHEAMTIIKSQLNFRHWVVTQTRMNFSHALRVWRTIYI